MLKLMDDIQYEKTQKIKKEKKIKVFPFVFWSILKLLLVNVPIVNIVVSVLWAIVTICLIIQIGLHLFLKVLIKDFEKREEKEEEIF